VVLLLTACSGLTADNNGVVALEIQVPTVPQIEFGDTLQLSAKATDQQGDSVSVPIRWRTPDTTLALDSLTGRVTSLVSSGTGRVQASYGDLNSDLVTFTLVPRADTLVVRPDTLDVSPGVPASGPLVALDSSFTLGALAGRRLVYLVASPTDGSVTLTGGGQALAVITGSDGTPVTPVTLNRVTAMTSPAQAAVEIRSYRPSGLLVPGSGQQIIVRFQN
jgi:hypothetical protein